MSNLRILLAMSFAFSLLVSGSESTQAKLQVQQNVIKQIDDHLLDTEKHIQQGRFSDAKKSLAAAEKLLKPFKKPICQSIRHYNLKANIEFSLFGDKTAVETLKAADATITQNPALLQSCDQCEEIYLGLMFVLKTSDPEAAIGYIEKAIKINDLYPDRSEQEKTDQKAYLVSFRALVYYQLGQIDKARSDLDFALPILKNSKDPALQSSHVTSVRDMAALDIQVGEYESALARLETAESPMFGEHYAATLCQNRAAAYIGLGRTAEAKEQITKAQQFGLGIFKANLFGLSDQEAINFSEFLAANRSIAIDLCVKENSPANCEFALDIAMQSKGIATAALNARAAMAVFAKEKPEFSAALKRFHAISQKHSDALMQSAKPELIQNLAKDKATAHQDLLPFLSKDVVDSLDTEAAKTKRLARRLPSDVAIVEILQYKSALNDRKPINYVALVARQNESKTALSVKMVDLGPVDKINELVEARNNSIRIANVRPKALLAERGIKKKGIKKGIKKAAKNSNDLDALTWHKIQPHVKGCQTVVICPNGQLSRLSWSSLVNVDNIKYLIENYQVVVNESAARVLAKLENETTTKQGCLGVGVSNGFHPVQNEPGLGQLKEAIPEVKTVFAMFGNDQNPGELLINEQATTSKVKKSLAQVGTIHIAAHGVLTDQWQKFFSGEINETELENNPLLNSALLLSGDSKEVKGANARPQFLTANDVLESDLSKVGLVVLSACDSGQGKTSKSEGIFGIEKSFRLAGAHSTLTSQFKLDDKNARIFVEQFFRNMREKGMSKSKALQQTQIEMIKNNVPIKNWSAWRLMGDWR